MLESVSYCAFKVFNESSEDFGGFAKNKDYSIVLNGKNYKSRTLIAQTWLIDLIYDISCLKHEGNKIINIDETLHLIALYNDLSNKRDGVRLKNKNDALINVFGFFGEQSRFQNQHQFFNDFAREKYIIENISEKCTRRGITKINTAKVFQNYTGNSFDEYSALVFLMFGYFCGQNPFIDIGKISTNFGNPLLSAENLKQITDKYSISIDEIKEHPLKRQIFYSKPIIKINDEYISVNPFLLLCLFTNSNYWVLRDYYYKMKSQEFTNEFGKYFEYYVEEILCNCLSENEYSRIEETATEKRADWLINVTNHTFLIEQKSSLSLLGIKQNQTNIDLMKKYIINCWGEASIQLKTTEKAYKIDSPIKIILLYEDYYKCECLDELFKINKDLENDGYYWLLNIKEFETLLLLYKDDPLLFERIICDKKQDEIEHCLDGRDIEKYFNKYNVPSKNYLKEYHITDQFNKIKDLCK